MNNQAPNSPNLQQSADSAEDEISFFDILHFLNGAWKTIVIAGIVGLIAAAAYLVITPEQFEATAQISMAQIGAANNNNNNNLNPLGINIEEPSLLIARMGQPTTFTPQVISGCGMGGRTNSGMLLAKSIKLALPKGVVNVVELRTFGESPEAALSCAQAIFDLIKTTQAEILAPYIEEARIKLKDDEERLAKAKELVAKADKSGVVMGAAYLSTRDEIRFLLDEITALKNVLISNQNRATRLIAPIYANDNPIAPKKRVVLAAGLFGGLLLGLLLALGHQLRERFKGELQ